MPRTDKDEKLIQVQKRICLHTIMLIVSKFIYIVRNYTYNVCDEKERECL